MKSYLFWILSGVQDLFGVSRKQAKGILVLQFLILLMLISPIIFSLFIPRSNEEIAHEDEILLNELIAKWETMEEVKQEDVPTFTTSQSEPSYFLFDPNEASQDELVSLGFPGWLAERLINFRNAGGSFKVKTDIKNVYGLQDWLYDRIEDYIQLPEEIDYENVSEVAENKESENTKSEKFEEDINKEVEPDLPLLLDINLADSTELQTIRGIGPAYSSRIVRFRDILGGFASIEQLKEVYGLTEETYEAIKPHIIIGEEFELKKLSINSADQAQLSAHPYISYNTARALVNYRKQHGNFQSLEDLSFVKVLSDSVINKIAPYLDFTINENP
ncbi:ComEA family DNA-binding protein [Fulvivirgaceae bacterium LMO-SS25]